MCPSWSQPVYEFATFILTRAILRGAVKVKGAK